MNNQPNAPFDKEQIYDEQIAPLVTQIIEICQANDLPLLLSVCYAWDEETGFELCTTKLHAEDWDLESYEEAKKVLLRKPFMLALTITSDPEQE